MMENVWRQMLVTEAKAEDLRRGVKQERLVRECKNCNEGQPRRGLWSAATLRGRARKHTGRRPARL